MPLQKAMTNDSLLEVAHPIVFAERGHLFEITLPSLHGSVTNAPSRKIFKTRMPLIALNLARVLFSPTRSIQASISRWEVPPFCARGEYTSVRFFSSPIGCALMLCI